MKLITKRKIAAGFGAFFLFLSIIASAQSEEPIFDGKTLNGWKKVAGSAPYEVIDGAIVGTMVKNTPNTFLVTEKEYGDFIFELDIKIEGEESNSGVQTRSHFDEAANGGKGKVYGRQVEIDATDRKWTGGVYDEARRMWLYPLALNPTAKEAFKVGEYNHFRIECIGDEIKTWINDTPIAYVIDTLDKTGFIGLQVHGISSNEEIGKKQEGKKVYFKNLK